MSDDDIRREVTGAKGRYVLGAPPDESELTYSILSPRLVIADHTVVAEGLRGTGAGLKLVERIVADARAEGFKIVPLCPYVNAQRRKHPDWDDAFQA